MLIAIFIYQN